VDFLNWEKSLDIYEIQSKKTVFLINRGKVFMGSVAIYIIEAI